MLRIEIEPFFDKIIKETTEGYKKIPTDIYNNFKERETFTIKEAKWIENALIRNKSLRTLQKPEIIQQEIEIALSGVNNSAPVYLSSAHLPSPTISPSVVNKGCSILSEIIREELEEAQKRILERINKNVLH